MKPLSKSVLQNLSDFKKAHIVAHVEVAVHNNPEVSEIRRDIAHKMSRVEGNSLHAFSETAARQVENKPDITELLDVWAKAYARYILKIGDEKEAKKNLEKIGQLIKIIGRTNKCKFTFDHCIKTATKPADAAIRETLFGYGISLPSRLR